jgi:rRNA maturation endonuclease Nob1
MVAMSNLLRRCHECAHPLGKKEIFCPRCGAKQRRSMTLITHHSSPITG